MPGDGRLATPSVVKAALLGTLAIILLHSEAAPSLSVSYDLSGGRAAAGSQWPPSWIENPLSSATISEADHPAHQCGLNAPPDLAGRYIIRFNSYLMQNEHRDSVLATLEDMAGAYAWLHRDNKAARHPTDFGLVQIQEGYEAAIKAKLVAQPWVKAVDADRQLTRSLAWEREEDQQAADHDLASPYGGDVNHLKPPGRWQTRPTIGLHGRGDDDPGAEDAFHSGANTTNSRRHLSYNFIQGGHSVTSLFQAEVLWNKGYKGQKVKMGVFDTGIREGHPHVKNIEERSNWTHEPTLADGLGHGSFVAGVIAGQDSQCPGFAPEVELHTFRVFTNDQVSYTSWFLDAFNYALATNMNIVNLSIGGPDYLDEPFVDKVLEITSNGMIMISAIGNDGPNYGTLNNPADQNDVIGVGGIDWADKIASFSSRGMSTWELPGGYGRSKPDVVAYGKDVSGSKIQTGCRTLSGTSVASPVVAGAVCLLASVVPEDKRWQILNPASMKQALVEGAVPVQGAHMYEQGQGKMNIVNSMNILKNYKPRASAVPAKVDLTACPFMWPFCKQPLYAHAMPVMLNMTVLNGMGVNGHFASAPTWTPDNSNAKLLSIDFAYSESLWPWSGFLVLYITVKPEGAQARGKASGRIHFTISSPPRPGDLNPRTSEVSIPVTANIVPTPKREQRILWDQFHSIRYPPGYIPRDSLEVRNDILDWHGDHPHTNYKDMFNFLIDAGYYVEVLGKPFTCFDANNYGSLILADSEEEYYPEEITKMQKDVEELGLGLVVFAEWYNKETMLKMRFFDDNTRSWWTPYTGGGNVPALNDLLAPYGIALGDAVLSGNVPVAGAKFASGADLIRFPSGGYIHRATLADKAPANVGLTSRNPKPAPVTGDHAVLGVAAHRNGRIAVYGDANCLDSSHQISNCFTLLRQLVEYTSAGRESTSLFTAQSRLHVELGSPSVRLPERRTDIDFKDVSTVLNFPASCGAEMDNAAWERRSWFQQTTQETLLLRQKGVGDFGTAPDPRSEPLSMIMDHHEDAVNELMEPKLEPEQVEQDAEPEHPVFAMPEPPNMLPTSIIRDDGSQPPQVKMHDLGDGAFVMPEAASAHKRGNAGTGHRSHSEEWKRSHPAGGPLIMGKGESDLPHTNHLHIPHLLAVAGILIVFLMWQLSRKRRHAVAISPRNSRAYRRVFGR